MNNNPQTQTQTPTASYDKTPKEPSLQTIAAYKKQWQELNFLDKRDYIDARRGFIATLAADGEVIKLPVDQAKIEKSDIPVPIWNLGAYAFLNSDPAPYSVNPSLWRQAQLNLRNGLFLVTTRTYVLNDTPVKRSIYQVRAFDLSNMTIVETNKGIIVIDPLISTETAEAALNLYYQAARPDRPPVVAVIYTHSHADHYGGVRGVITDEALQAGTVKIYAPDGFLDHAVSENVYAGSAMHRRSLYMYGALLRKDVKGQVDSGLGKTNSLGESSLIPPTVVINESGACNIDGVDIDFMLAEDTEAPAEMLFHFPQFKALCAAEDMTHNLHNLYSLRGAQVRNAVAWWKVINDAIKRFANQTDVLFAQHHWPIWNDPDNPGEILNFLKKQRDLYKYIHDQSLRLLNHGRTMIELASMLVLPKSLSVEWYNRGYYGTVNHDAKAVYQRYMGWYDANPATLHSLSPVEASKRYVEYMGGAQAVLDRAQQAFDAGEYRWVAEVVNHVIFAADDSYDPNPPDPVTLNAKLLQADALEQMGYQAESGPWRNCYLMGAHELRHGVPSSVLKPKPLSIDIMSAMRLDQYFDYMGLRFNAPEAMVSKTFIPQTTINWIVNNTDLTTEYYTLESVDYTLPYTSYDESGQLPPADVTLTMDRTVLDEISTTADMTMTEAFNLAVAEGKIKVEGDSSRVTAIFDLLDTFPADFDIVTPREKVLGIVCDDDAVSTAAQKTKAAGA
ncbi:MAG TPA: alkyl sulfatase dimerization domain-containing protein [Pyrinomonadaceae bacterium]|nr:alkyl sulfatase dimerization domain-containing protein [Pyrinomonadaceae bacterium]